MPVASMFPQNSKSSKVGHRLCPVWPLQEGCDEGHERHVACRSHRCCRRHSLLLHEGEEHVQADHDLLQLVLLVLLPSVEVLFPDTQRVDSEVHVFVQGCLHLKGGRQLSRLSNVLFLAQSRDEQVVQAMLARSC